MQIWQVAEESPPYKGGNMGGNAESEPSSLTGDGGLFIFIIYLPYYIGR